jgi:hypothetical protein
MYCNIGSRDSSVCIATGYGLEGRDSIPGRGKRFFPSPQGQERLWSPPSALTNGYRGLLPKLNVKLTTHIHLVLR